MDLFKNYYSILGIENTANADDIKKAYRKLANIHHPDKGGDNNIFVLLLEAYDVLFDNTKKEEYDKKSKWGKEYDELTEYFNFDSNIEARAWDKDKLDNFKKIQELSIVVYVDETFNGSLTYERWVLCKSCEGSGKDHKSKIEIKDSNGKVKMLFDASDGCDFCEGSGKDWLGNPCGFCFGVGKMGSVDCNVCNGTKRILGKQKLSKIPIPTADNPTKLEYMGHCSTVDKGKSGHLWVILKK